jgi:cation:H+ antiporter
MACLLRRHGGCIMSSMNVALLWTWLQLMGIAGAILLAGTQLSRYGDRIARKTGLSGGWVGMVLVASVTSLPELVTGASSVLVANAPEVAVGNVLGACVLNLAMIAVLDVLHRRASIYQLASQGHALGAGFAVLMLGTAGLALLLPRDAAPVIGHVSIITPLLFVWYGVAMRSIYEYEQRAQREHGAAAQTQAPEPLTLGALLLRYAAAAAVVVLAALWLPMVALALAQQMGWTTGFVGTLLVAFTTTLPELAVTLAAVRLGALDLAIGNLVGSSLFNLVVLGIGDLLFRQGSLYAAVSETHAVSAFTGVMMAGAVVVALVARQQARVLNFVGWTGVLLALLFFFNSWVQFRHGA